MEKKLVVISQGNQEDEGGLADIFKASGWNLETIRISPGEPLPKSLENVGGLLILSDTVNVFEQSMWPLTVYMDS